MDIKARRRILKLWTTPIVLSVALPAHADLTAYPPEPNIQYRNLELAIEIQSCTNKRIDAQICNQEPFDISIIGASVEIPLNTISGASFISHSTPFIIPAGDCVSVSLFLRFINSFVCEPPWLLVVAGDSGGSVGEFDLIEGNASISF